MIKNWLPSRPNKAIFAKRRSLHLLERLFEKHSAAIFNSLKKSCADIPLTKFQALMEAGITP